MWISRKFYNFLKENAEKNIDMECQILTAKKMRDEPLLEQWKNTLLYCKNETN